MVDSIRYESIGSSRFGKNCKIKNSEIRNYIDRKCQEIVNLHSLFKECIMKMNVMKTITAVFWK
jgi:hypothetical protein